MIFFYRRYILQLFLISCCSISIATAADDIQNKQFIKFETEELQLGRDLWIENCKGCHAYGTAGAPIPMFANDWKKRVIKDRSVLYKHAINGFFGPDDTMMPERGGNPELTDKQVKLAVDYMVQLANFYINNSPN